MKLSCAKRKIFAFLMAFMPFLSIAQVHEWTENEVALQAPLLKNMGTEWTQESAPVATLFNGVMLEGTTTDTQLRGEIRFFENSKWTNYTPLSITFMGESLSFLATYRSEAVRQNQAFSVRFFVNEAQHIKINEAGTWYNFDDEERTSPAFPTNAPLQFVPSGVIKTPNLIRRSDWGARPYNCSGVDIQPYYRYLTLHHTAWPVQQNLLASFKNMKDIQNFHIDGRAWCDIGYQFLMDQKGNAFQGRPFADESKSFASGPALVIGAHVGSGNSGNIGMSLMGCFHPPENSASLNCLDKQNEALLDSVVTMFAYLADTYKIPADNIRGHRDFNSTSCPGDVNYALLHEIRWRVKTKLKAAGSPVANESSELPKEITLSPNYPNPFNPATNIRFFLPQNSEVELNVFDITGRKMATLAHDTRVGGQWHNVVFDATHLPSGAYLIRLNVSANGQTQHFLQTANFIK